jgi:hypothetical protein
MKAPVDGCVGSFPLVETGFRIYLIDKVVTVVLEELLQISVRTVLHDDPQFILNF